MKERKYLSPFTMCQFCSGAARETYNHCTECGYPLRWNEGIAVPAPESLIEFARDWHGGQWSGLYSVLSTGQIFIEKALDIESELRSILRNPRALDNGPTHPDVIQDHLDAIEHLTAQLPDAD